MANTGCIAPSIGLKTGDDALKRLTPHANRPLLPLQQQDRVFDGLSAKFGRRIYDTRKGDLRRELVMRDLQQVVPALSGNKPLSILDIGGGQGQLSLLLAAQGHRVMLVDPSAEMLALAQRDWQLLYADDATACPPRFVQKKLQDLTPQAVGGPDLILFHAVMEWLADPLAGLAQVASWLKPEAYLSVIFFNKHSAAWMRLMRGRLRAVREDRLAGNGRSLSPTHPLDPQWVLDWLATQPLSILRYSGLRCFSDYLDELRLAQEPDPQDLLETEWLLSQREPYRSLARYLHLVIQSA